MVDSPSVGYEMALLNLDTGILIPRVGQGPYFGQATWFTRFHPEKLLSAIDRYVIEIFLVIGVLDNALQRNATG